MWKTPQTNINTLCYSMAQQPHILIAGTTGSGKSVLINSFIYDLLSHPPDRVQLVLIDIKHCELIDYKNLPHTICHITEPRDIVQCFKYLHTIMENRFNQLSRTHTKQSKQPHIYIIIDEYVDIKYSPFYRQIEPLLISFLSRGRAANIHVILATQRPTRDVITGVIKANFPACVGLRTVNSQESRNIIGVAGCELLPLYGYCYLRSPQTIQPELYKVPYTSQTDIYNRVDYWIAQIPRKKHKLFK